MKTRSVIPMKIAKTGYIIMSLVFCMAGILFIIKMGMRNFTTPFENFIAFVTLSHSSYIACLISQ